MSLEETSTADDAVVDGFLFSPLQAIGSISGDSAPDSYEERFGYLGIDNAENPEDYYSPGGLRPTHIGDYLKERRYKVIHKLGHGGFATVWLARDFKENKYIALKILRAEYSQDCDEVKWLDHLKVNQSNHPGRQYVATLLDRFEVTSPNGKHLVLVSPVYGPRVSQMSGIYSRLRPNAAQKTAKQASQGLAYLHSIGICHGDFSSNNVLFQLADFNSWSEKQIYEQLGYPVAENLVSRKGQKLDDTAPKYVVQQADFYNPNLDPTWLLEEIVIIDFGESFWSADPPTGDALGTPLGYKSPELMLDLTASVYSDIWALGCIIYHMRTGRKLFEDDILGSVPELSINTIIDILGSNNFPKEWANIPFNEEGWPVQEQDSRETSHSLTVYRPGQQPCLYKILANIEDEDKYQNDYGTTHVRPGLFWKPPPQETSYLMKDDGKGGKIFTRPPEKAPKVLPKISQQECESLYDLLAKIFIYQPEERITAEELVKHPWFTSQFP